MRRIALGRTGIETSRLGFGCASLGSRVGAAEGLRAIEAAFEKGVTWLDLAPAYGRGEAEPIAAQFLKGRRDRVQVATKVGLAPPRAGGRLASLVMPVARRAVGALPSLRAALRRTGIQSNQALSLTPALLQTSLESSLRRLETDYLDIYALHNATAADLARDDLLRALEDIVSSGKARAIAVASDEKAAQATLAGGPVSVVQIPLPPPGAFSVLPEIRAAGLGIIVHSVFGLEADGASELHRLKADPALQAKVATITGTSDLQVALARLRFSRALASVPEGVVLVSMFSERSRRENLSMVDLEEKGEAVELTDCVSRKRVRSPHVIGSVRSCLP